MDSQDNHYGFLGLEITASRQELAAAVERLSEQAARLVYTSPQRSHELWERIRQIKDDLLLDEDRREAYNRALLEPDRGRTVDLLTVAADVPVTEDETVGRGQPVTWLVLAGAIFAVILISSAILLVSLTKPGPPLATPAIKLSNVPVAGLTSGRTVILRWSPLPLTSRFRLQIATSASDPSDSVIFRHPKIDTLLNIPRFRLHVAGPQFYYWRIRAEIHGVWLPFSSSKHFFVGKPAIEPPRAITPREGEIIKTIRARLCWTPVSGAVQYHLVIEGRASTVMTGTCGVLNLSPGTYRWEVAARVPGTRLFTGPFSLVEHFTIYLKPRQTTGRPAVAAGGGVRRGKPRVVASLPPPVQSPGITTTNRETATTQVGSTQLGAISVAGSYGCQMNPRQIACTTPPIATLRSGTVVRVTPPAPG